MAVCALVVLPMCSSGEGSGGAGPLTLDRIVVSPQDASVTTGAERTSIRFSAKAYWSTGDVTDDPPVTWSGSNRTAGTIDEDGLFTPSADNGGITLISARYLGVTGSATLTVVFKQDILDEGVPETVPAAFDALSSSIDESRAPIILYPYNETVVPRNIEELEILWTSDETDPEALTVLVVESETTLTRYFTMDDRWVPTQAQWQTLAATNSGGTLTILPYRVEATSDEEGMRLNGPAFRPSAPTELTISRLDAEGAVYYWSISAEGIYRIPYDGTGASLFYPSEGTEGAECVSCHTLSPTGRRLAVVYEGDPKILGMLELHEDGGTPDVLVSKAEGVPSSRATFSPDDRYLLGVESGQLYLYDGQTLDLIAKPDLGFDRVANPAFSPDGSQLVFVVPSEFRDDTSFYGGRLAIVPFYDGVFGVPEWLTERVDGMNQYYPAWSPDGDWIVFNMSTEDPDDDSEGDSLMDLSAAVYVIAAEGGVPIRLDRLNDVSPFYLGPEADDPSVPLGDMTDPAKVANSWPGWAPLPDADLLWLSFSSLRGYGDRVEYGVAQIWISAFDPSLAAAGIDPSSPPFWLPRQGYETTNHIPQWGPY